MNKRQKKENFKKLHGCNPPTDGVKIRQRKIEKAEKNLIKIAKKREKRIAFLEKDLASKIQEMSKKEYERVLKELTPGQQVLVRNMHNKGKQKCRSRQGPY